MASIGHELKRERELRGIALQEIAEMTKINIRFLRALEEDQLDMLPEKFFTRGIIRTYAQYLGLDEENALNLYLENQRMQHDQEMLKEEEDQQSETQPPSLKKGKKFGLFFGGFIIILALSAALIFILKKEEPLPPENKAASVIQKTQEKPEQESVLRPLASSSGIQDETEEGQDGLNLGITVEQATWMEIYADGEIQYSGLKPPGAFLEFRALEEFLINVGNAGGISYTINGQKGIRLGKPGEVKKDIQITSDNYEDFLEKEEDPSKKANSQYLSLVG
jgi:cytoskeletal protein RodZ